MHLQSHPSARGIPNAQSISTGHGVSHPTPQEVAEQLLLARVAAFSRGAQVALAEAVKRQEAFVRAHPKPGSHAQPSEITDWLNGAGLSPRAAYPEWDWKIIQKGPPLGAVVSSIAPDLAQKLASQFEPGESVAAVQLGDHDVVTWYVHPSGAWNYHHVWGEDWTQVLGDVASAVGHALQDAAKVVGDVLHYVQIAASFIPGVGQIVNEVVTAAETALEALSGDNALQIALESAYHAAIAAVPGAEALTTFLDPVIDVLKTLAGGKGKIAKEAISQALSGVPDSPKVGDLSPHSIASSLASWLASKLGIA